MEGNPIETTIEYNTVLTEVAATASSMSPDTNHNELTETPEVFPGHMNGLHKEAAVPEEVLNGAGTHPTTKTVGGVPEEFTTAKAVAGQDEDRIREYLQRSDTAVIYPEPVGGRPEASGECLVNISAYTGFCR